MSKNRAKKNEKKKRKRRNESLLKVIVMGVIVQIISHFSGDILIAINELMRIFRNEQLR